MGLHVRGDNVSFTNVCNLMESNAVWQKIQSFQQMRTLGTLTGSKGETSKMTTFDIRFRDTYHTNTSCMRVCTSRQSMQEVQQHNKIGIHTRCSVMDSRRRKWCFMISMAGKAIRRWWALFALPTFAAFIIGFVVPFLMGVYLSFCEFTTVTDGSGSVSRTTARLCRIRNSCMHLASRPHSPS